MSTLVFADALVKSVAAYVPLSDAMMSRLSAHYELLLRWNQKLNLTTITDAREAAVRHYAESILLTREIDWGLVADVGSGPGFPGIPLAIVRPDLEVTVIESHQRKAVFLRVASEGLGNVRVESRRAEVVEGVFRWMVSRAVDPKELMKLRICQRYALLVGAGDAEGLSGLERVVPLPWGERRVIAIGVPARVPRETTAQK